MNKSPMQPSSAAEATPTPENARQDTPDRLRWTWLAVLPVVLVSLLCCGQMALVFSPQNPGAYTISRIQATYQPWQDEVLPGFNAQAMMQDIETDQLRMGTPLPTLLVETPYWQPPTSAAATRAVIDDAPTPVLSSTPIPSPSVALTFTPLPSPTTAATLTNVPTATAQPTPTRTRVLVLPSATATKPPPTPTNPPPTAVPTLTNTALPPAPTALPATATSTHTPLPSDTPTHTPTPLPTDTPTKLPTVKPSSTIPPVPTYAPVRPIAENGGAATPITPGSCQAVFGYRNDNPFEVDLPLDPLRNALNDPAALINPGLTTHFLVGRIFGAFDVTWSSGQDLVWSLDGRTATARWCSP